MSDRLHPGWNFKGKNYRTVNGLCNAIAKDCGASQVGGVNKSGKINCWPADRDGPVLATYAVTTPVFVVPCEVTREY
jgi:hypothetical protein